MFFNIRVHIQCFGFQFEAIMKNMMIQWFHFGSQSVYSPSHLDSFTQGSNCLFPELKWELAGMIAHFLGMWGGFGGQSGCWLFLCWRVPLVRLLNTMCGKVVGRLICCPIVFRFRCHRGWSKHQVLFLSLWLFSFQFSFCFLVSEILSVSVAGSIFQNVFIYLVLDTSDDWPMYFLKHFEPDIS